MLRSHYARAELRSSLARSVCMVLCDAADASQRLRPCSCINLICARLYFHSGRRSAAGVVVDRFCTIQNGNESAAVQIFLVPVSVGDMLSIINHAGGGNRGVARAISCPSV